MRLEELLAELAEKDIQLRKVGDDLAVRGSSALADRDFIDELRAHKNSLLELIGGENDKWWSPSTITPEMLPLVRLTAEEIARIVSRVPGGAANVQDIYPLAPLQEGILFHHLMEGEGDPYLLGILYSFDSRGRLENYLKALEAVIARHDILRTAVIWEGLTEPVQVVWREAVLPVEEVELDRAAGDVAKQLYARFNPRRHRIDVHQAPLLRVYIAYDSEQNRWVMMQLLHHLVGDHSTMDVIREEITAHLLGEADRLPAPLPFRNLVAQARLGVSQQEHEAYFRGLLGDVEEPTAPFGLLDTRGDGAEITEARMAVDGDVARRLRKVARKLGVSAASLYHVAWGRVVAKVSGREDVVFGTVLFGRMQGGVGSDRAMGLFINTLPVRIRIGEEGVEASVRRTHAQLAELLRHEHTSLALAQRCSGVLAPLPLFTTLLNYRHTLTIGQKGADERRAWEGIRGLYGEERTNYPLTLSVDDLEQGFGLTVQVDRSIEPKRVCEYMHTTLKSVVEALESEPSRAVQSLEVLPEEERKRVLYEWNRTEVEYPRDKCIHELFEEQVEKTPEAVAVVFEEASLSYAELNRRANRLAHYLISRGIGPENIVAAALPRSFQIVIGLLGILKSGAAYLPLDTNYPAERIAFMLEDGRPTCILTIDCLVAALPQTVPLLILDDRTLIELLDLSPEYNPTNPERTARLNSENAAYVIYTSGSSGTPKGCVVPHRSLPGIVHHRNYATFDEKQVTLQHSSISSDALPLELWPTLLTGGRSILFNGRELDSIGLDYLVRRHCIKVLWLSSRLFNTIIDLNPACLRLIKSIFIGGEAPSPDHVKRAMQLLPGVQVNGYRPSECTVVSCCYRIGTAADEMISIGAPIGDRRVYVLDRMLQPVPINVCGEIYIAGAAIARGYMNRPELTAERFVADPFVSEAGARMYRTGDVGRWLADGNIEFLGRTDFQVKIRGYRIELGEIEAAIAQHPGVREGVVLAREDTAGDKRLVAYYTATEEGEGGVGAEQLRNHLLARLPEYMVPAAYVRLANLPLTANGKLDRKGLPAPEADAYVVRGYEAPQTETEEELARIWGEVLKLERVGRHDNIFELGGHSLLVVTMIERMRRAGLHVDPRVLFATPTVAALAAAIAPQGMVVEVPANRIPAGCGAITPEMLPLVRLTAEEIARIVSRVPGGAANVQDIYPLAPLQEGILFHHLMEGEGDPYLLGILYSFDSRGRLENYLKALEAVIARHDILRTAVIWEGLTEPVQVVWREAVLPVEEVELDRAAGDVAKQLYARFNPRRHRIDVHQAPLLRVYIAYDSEQNRWVMMQLLHHLVGDHSTMDVIREEITAHLLGEADRLPAPLPFRNLVAQARLGVSQQEHEAYFRGLLGDVEEPTAPFGLLDTRGDGAEITEARMAVDGDVARRLRKVARKLGVSAASLYHVAWGRVVAKVSGREDVVFGTVLFGRMQGGVGSDRAMGLFINTLPVRIRIGEEGVEASVRRTHAQLAELLRHEHTSLALAQRCSGVLAPLPLFTALLNYRHILTIGQKGADERRAWEGIRGLYGEERTNYPLTLSVDDLEQGFGLTVQVDRSIEPKRVCEYMHTTLKSVVEALESEPSRAVQSLEVLPEEERKRVLYEWNRTEVEYPRDKCIHELFEEQVEKTPEAVAVVFEEASLSYAELNRRANRLAHYLRGLGVRPDTRVAICVERGFEMIVGLLGVLKAGGAYVPLDPAYPVERLRFMLEDSAPVAVLTQASMRGLLAEVSEAVLVIELDPVEEPWKDHSETNPQPGSVGLTSEHLAYVIYTSGSTGTPKGVMAEHRATVNRLVWMHKEFPFDSNEVCCLKCSYSFVDSIWELFGPLLSGISIIVLPTSVDRNPLEIARIIREYGVTRLSLVPSLLRALLESHAAGIISLPNLNYWTTSGESLPRLLANELLRCMPRGKLLNLYGSTEDAADVTFYDVATSNAKDDKSVPIGRPIANAQVYILDPQGDPVPIGVAGELYIGGVGVARGYLKRPELTAERFVADPFVGGAGARMYRTGDMGRWLADGNIEFLGRTDFQVKIRGCRIESSEIEVLLAQCAGVREGVVVAREDTAGDKRLVAYYTATKEGDGEIGAEHLRAHLVARVPEYMVPSAYVRMEELPLTANGKLDRKGLPAPEADAYGVRGYEEPQTETEEDLARIWREVLKLERVGRHDNFFELGGHSLLAVRAVLILDQIGIKIRTEDLFANPTILSLAEKIQTRRTSVDSPICLRSAALGLPVFLTHEGTGELLYLHALTPHIDASIPIYGLPAMDIDRVPLLTVEEMAARMVKMIRAVQAHGPYRIAGWSFGALLAYEIAVQLVRANQLIDFLGLLDGSYPQDDSSSNLLESSLENELASLTIDDVLKECLPVTDIDISTILEMNAFVQRWQKKFNLTPIQLRKFTVRAVSHFQAGRRYRPPRLAVPAYVFVSQEHANADPWLGWHQAISKNLLHTRQVAGTHQSMMSSPNVEMLGLILSQAIRESRAFNA